MNIRIEKYTLKNKRTHIPANDHWKTLNTHWNRVEHWVTTVEQHRIRHSSYIPPLLCWKKKALSLVNHTPRSTSESINQISLVAFTIPIKITRYFYNLRLRKTNFLTWILKNKSSHRLEHRLETIIKHSHRRTLKKKTLKLHHGSLYRNHYKQPWSRRRPHNYQRQSTAYEQYKIARIT